MLGHQGVALRKQQQWRLADRETGEVLDKSAPELHTKCNGSADYVTGCMGVWVSTWVGIQLLRSHLTEALNSEFERYDQEPSTTPPRPDVLNAPALHF